MLTKKEKEVMKLLLLGKTNKEISDTLVISQSTAKAHLEHIFKKLNVHNRLQAVIVYMEKMESVIPENVN